MWKSVSSPDGSVSGYLSDDQTHNDKPLLICIHGGGCNGKYFDLKGSSTAQAAQQRGFSVLLVNRPGYHGNAIPVSKSPISATASVIRSFIDEVRHRHSADQRCIVMIGHSIGGAIAVHLASGRGEWPLAGLAISGIGDESPPLIKSLKIPSGAPTFQPPAEFTEALFFDPDRTLCWKAVSSLREATEPWLASEVIDVVEQWPDQWPALAAKVDIPVHLRLAEHERIWETGQAIVDRMSAKFVNSPEVDAALLVGGGHLYEVSKGGPKAIRAQLDFLEACAERLRLSRL